MCTRTDAPSSLYVHIPFCPQRQPNFPRLGLTRVSWNRLRAHFDFASKLEIGIEADPRYLDAG